MFANFYQRESSVGGRIGEGRRQGRKERRQDRQVWWCLPRTYAPNPLKSCLEWQKWFANYF